MAAKVTIYTRPDCPYCAAAKEDFKKRGVTFEELDVLDNEKNRKVMIELTGERKVPAIVEGDKVTIGFGGY